MRILVVHPNLDLVNEPVGPFLFTKSRYLLNRGSGLFIAQLCTIFLLYLIIPPLNITVLTPIWGASQNYELWKCVWISWIIFIGVFLCHSLHFKFLCTMHILLKNSKLAVLFPLKIFEHTTYSTSTWNISKKQQ